MKTTLSSLENTADAKRRQDAAMTAWKLAAIRRHFGDKTSERLSRRMKAGDPDWPELAALAAENGLDAAVQEFFWSLVARAVREMSAEDFKTALLIVVAIRQIAMAEGRHPEMRLEPAR